MKERHKVAVNQGYEGIMLRNYRGVYESGKRSNDLQKFKTMMDSEFAILDVMVAKYDGSVFLVRNDLNDRTFTVTLGSMVQRAGYLANKELYIGKEITVSYQTRYKKTLLPQFPTGVAIRDYE
jgi:DNA ligase-1